jgi:regulator of protease activity HflC (stomatin/prohibitin superfamily)
MAAVAIVIAVAVLLLIGALSIRVVREYERLIIFRLGKLRGGAHGPGLVLIIPLIETTRRVSMRIVTMPIQSQGIITKDNVSVDIAAVAYYRVVDPVRSVIAIENVSAAINQIAQTTLRAVIGRHTLDESLAEVEKINKDLRAMLDIQTEEWGASVLIVEMRDIALPDTMRRAMAKQAEAEREKRAKIIASQGEALAAGKLAEASDVMMEHPLALQLRNLQTLVELGVDKNSTIIFPSPLMSTIEEIGGFLSREDKWAGRSAADANERRARPASNGSSAQPDGDIGNGSAKGEFGQTGQRAV